ncbi:MAG: hypothetical protein JW734_07995 [Candidatus Omnitrophica bacterium]|nr:hypothetical protein [Candidatus Omnitrophota bacterium]
MKAFKKIIMFLFAVLAFVYACLWIFVNIKGKDLLIEKLVEVTKKEVEIDSMSFRPLIGLNIDDFTIEDTKIGELGVSLSFLKLLSGKIGFNTIKIEDVDIGIIKEDKKISTSVMFLLLPAPKEEPEVLPEDSKDQEVGESGPARKMPPLFVKKLKIEDARVNFTDKTGSDEFKGSFYIKRAVFKNITYPDLGKIYFDINSDFKIGDTYIDDNLDFKGYIDMGKKSMDAELEIKRLPYRSFSVYYPPFWNSDNLGIEEADFSLVSDFSAVDNDLTIKAKLRLVKHKFADSRAGRGMVPIIKIMLENLKDSEGIPTLYYEGRTELDNPKIDFATIKNQFQAQIKNLPFSMGKKSVEEVTEVGKEATEKVVDVTAKALNEAIKSPEKIKEIGKETVKTLKSIFMPEEEPDDAPQEQPLPEN